MTKDEIPNDQRSPSSEIRIVRAARTIGMPGTAGPRLSEDLGAWVFRHSSSLRSPVGFFLLDDGWGFLFEDEGVEGGFGGEVIEVGSGGAEAPALVSEEEDDGVVSMGETEGVEGEDVGEGGLLEDAS